MVWSVWIVFLVRKVKIMTWWMRLSEMVRNAGALWPPGGGCPSDFHP
jgi:hypothetical protein